MHNLKSYQLHLNIGRQFHFGQTVSMRAVNLTVITGEKGAPNRECQLNI